MDNHDLQYIFTHLYGNNLILVILNLHDLELFIFTWFQFIFHKNNLSKIYKLTLRLNAWVHFYV